MVRVLSVAKRALLCLVLLSFTTVARAEGDHLAKALDYAFMKAKPWRAVQGLPHDESAMNMLTTFTLYPFNIAPDLVDELAALWDAEYDDDRVDAIAWTSRMIAVGLADSDQVYWKLQRWYLMGENLKFLAVESGTDADLMRAWAYLERFYGDKDVTAIPPSLFSRPGSQGLFSAHYLSPRILRAKR